MLCYRDRTFCNAECSNNECPIRVTDKLWKEADDFGLPLALADFSNTCKVFIPNKNSK